MNFKDLITGLILAILFAGCAEKETLIPDAPTVVGLWRNKNDDRKVYEFRESGAATFKFISFGQTIYTNEYSYVIAEDVITLIDIEQGTVSHYDLAFPTDSSMTLEVHRKTGLGMTLVKY